MVRYQNVGGNAIAARAARGKHYVLFDLPVDKGAELKTKQPNLGWVTDIEGHPSLPFSVASRLILSTYAEQLNRDVGVLEEFATEQLLARLWAAITPHLKLDADNIFQVVEEAASQVENKTVFIGVAGDWRAVEGDIDGEGHTRWVDTLTRGDAFGSDPTVDLTVPSPGMVGAESLARAVGNTKPKRQRGR